jgi:NTP-dependent ternary system trypsin peptidase co-occuring protein
MNVSEFIEETLTEILIGIRNAQKKHGGGMISAEMYGDTKSLGVVASGQHGNFTAVQFDVSVLAETKGGGKAGNRVWSVGAEGSGEHTSQHTSRIKFAVPLRLPEGDKAEQSDFNKREL